MTFALAARAPGTFHDEWCPGVGQLRPGEPAGYDGIVVLGGEQNVADAPRLRYLQDEIALIGEALERRQPLLGVCLGAQLLVAAAGGEVVRVSDPEIGWYEVEALPEAAADPLFGALPPRFSSYCWHSYGVELPEEATLLARSAVSIHGFRLGESAWGVQFHPEVTREILLGWFASYRDDQTPSPWADLSAEGELGGRLPAWEALGRRLFGAFRPPRPTGWPGNGASVRSRMRSKTATISASNCEPAPSRSSPRAPRARARAGTAVGGHRLVGVGDREDARLERDRLAGEARRVSAPVDALVVGEHPVADVAQVGVLEDPRAELRVAADLLPLAVVQRAGLVEDGVGDPQLADVVQHAGGAHALDALGGNPSSRAICSA